MGLVGYSQLVYPLSQTALSQKPVSWKAVSQPVSKFKKDQLTIIHFHVDAQFSYYLRKCFQNKHFAPDQKFDGRRFLVRSSLVRKQRFNYVRGPYPTVALGSLVVVAL